MRGVRNAEFFWTLDSGGVLKVAGQIYWPVEYKEVVKETLLCGCLL